MTQDLETVMKNALDGKFFSFFQTQIGTLRVSEKTVPINHMPDYTEKTYVENRGGWRAANLAKWRKATWTDQRLCELRRLHGLGYGAKRLEREMNLGRCEIEIQLNKMGLRNRKGQRYK